MKNKVSIIIPIYNCAEYISDCIESIIHQSYSNIEIIIVNDGSSDDSLSICKKYEKKDDRIIIINNKNNGVSYSRNCGIKKSSGEYICFIDADDWIHKNYIEKLVDCIKNNNDIAMCNYISAYCHNQIINKYNNIDINDDYLSFITKNNCWNPWAKLFKKATITEMFDVDVSSSEDLLFNFMNSKNIIRIGYVDEALYYYRRKDDEQFSITNVGKKQLTELDAIMFMIEKCSTKNKSFFIGHYISILYRILFFDNKNSIKTFKEKDKYIKYAKLKYMDLFKQKCHVSKLIKYFVMIYLKPLYFILYNFKLRQIKYK